jgi:hypothetical protein
MKKDKQSFLDDITHNYFKGDVPLKISFWGIYIFGWNIVVSFVLGFILLRMGFELNTSEIVMAPITVLLAVGVWNSAGKYKGKKIWSVLARIVVAIQSIGSITNAIALLMGIDFIQ